MSTILVIDDEPDMARLVGISLAGEGVRVVHAAGLEQAVAIAGAERPRLVLLDLALGDEDGLAILPDLRRARALHEVPVVAFTVHDSRREEALAHGVDGFLAKPFRPGELRDLVGPFLAGGDA